MHREKQNLCSTHFFSNNASRINSVKVRHRDIRDNDVGLMKLRHLNQHAPVTSNSNNFEFLLQKVGKALNQNRVIVRQQDARSFHGFSCNCLKCSKSMQKKIG